MHISLNFCFSIMLCNQHITQLNVGGKLCSYAILSNIHIVQNRKILYKSLLHCSVLYCASI